jgi:hypothetical protein
VHVTYADDKGEQSIVVDKLLVQRRPPRRTQGLLAEAPACSSTSAAA